MSLTVLSFLFSAKQLKQLGKGRRMLKRIGECWTNRKKQSRNKQQTKKVCPFQVVQLLSSCFNLCQLFQRLFPLLNFYKFSGNPWMFHGEHDKFAWKIDFGRACRPSLRGNGPLKKQSRYSVVLKRCDRKKCSRSNTICAFLGPKKEAQLNQNSESAKCRNRL